MMRSFVAFSIRGIIAAIFLSFVSTSQAAMVNYQGILTNATGDSLLNGTYNLSFSIFESETGGTSIWDETHTDVEVDHGFYSVTLGSVTALPNELGDGNWLEIEVNDTALEPRLEILSDFRAIEALHAENADSVNHIPASESPTPGHLVPLGADGVFPDEVIPFRADSVLAGEGLTATVSRQSRSLDERVGLNVGQGDGIIVSADAVSATLGEDIQTVEIEDLAVTTAKIANNAVTTTKLAANAVTTAEIAPATIITADLAPNSVTTNEIVNGTIATADLALNSVTTNEIVNGTVANADLAPNSVTTNEIVNGTVANADLAPNSVTTNEIVNGTIANADLAPNSVTTIEIVNNSVSAADIFPDIVSSVDGVDNDGGDIDFIPGANIVITPDNVAKTITFSAAAGGVQGGTCIDVDQGTTPPTIDLDLDFLSNSNCIDVDYDPIDCQVTFDFDFAADGDNCIDVDWDADNCELTIQSLLNLLEGTCIDINHNVADCDYTISVDMSCFEHMIDSLITAIFDTLTIEVDSTFDSEIYARSYVITDDPASGTTTGARGHWHADGTLELYGSGGDTVRINPNGTLEIIQDGELVAGVDEDGEMFARSFYVINADGDTLAHIRSDGTIANGTGGSGNTLYPGGGWDSFIDGELVAGVDQDGEVFGRSFYVLAENGDTLAHIRSDGKIEGARVVVSSGGSTTDIQPGSVTTGNASSSTTQSADGISVTGSAGGVTISPNGTWSATQDDRTVAGLDSNGELFAKSLYIKDPVTGDTLIHLTSDGNIELEEGAQVTIGGVPIEGGGGSVDSTFDSEVYARSFVVTPDGTLENATAHVTSSGQFNGTGVTAAGSNSGVYLQENGTWFAIQNGQIVAGLDNHGEIHAKSFYIQSGTDTLVHITNDGYVIVQGDTLTPGGSGEGDIITRSGEGNESTFGADGIATGNAADGSGVMLYPNGQWAASQDGQSVAGLDGNGELFARSFFVRNADGDTLAHITSEGQFIGPDGIPLGGDSEQDSVFESEVYAKSFVVTSTGLLGDAKAHLTSSGNLELEGELSGGGAVTTSAPDIGGHTNEGTFSPTQMSVQNVNAEINSGWQFNSDGTATQHLGGASGVEFTSEGYSVFPMPLFIGPMEFSQYFFSEGPDGIYTSGSLTVGDKLTVFGTMDPIICEVFKTKQNYRYEPGTVIVMDPATDAFIPCFESAQTSVVGVVSPGAKIDEKGNILTVILGATAPPRKDGTRLEAVIKADASFGAIKRGDLLTTSTTEGHAMLAADPKLGTIVGKALESLDSGRGEIKVMVTLN